MCKLVVFTSLSVEDVERVINRHFVGVRLYDEYVIEGAWVFEVGAYIVSLYDLEAIHYELKEFDFDMTATCIQVML